MKLKYTKVAPLVAALITFGSLVVGVNAATPVVLSPTAVINNTIGNFGAGFSDALTIDQSGLSSTFTSGSDDFDDFISTNPTHTDFSEGFWFGPDGTITGVIDYSLGGMFNLDRIALWKDIDNDGTLNQFTVFTADNSGFSGATNVGTFNLSDFTDAAQVFDIVDSHAEFLRIELVTTHGSTNFTGFGEIVVSATPIPEPSSALLLGLGALGMVVRRKRTA